MGSICNMYLELGIQKMQLLVTTIYHTNVEVCHPQIPVLISNLTFQNHPALCVRTCFMKNRFHRFIREEEN